MQCSKVQYWFMSPRLLYRIKSKGKISVLVTYRTVAFSIGLFVAMIAGDLASW